MSTSVIVGLAILWTKGRMKEERLAMQDDIESAKQEMEALFALKAGSNASDPFGNGPAGNA